MRPVSTTYMRCEKILPARNTQVFSCETDTQYGGEILGSCADKSPQIMSPESALAGSEYYMFENVVQIWGHGVRKNLQTSEAHSPLLEASGSRLQARQHPTQLIQL